MVRRSRATRRRIRAGPYMAAIVGRTTMRNAVSHSGHLERNSDIWCSFNVSGHRRSFCDDALQSVLIESGSSIYLHRCPAPAELESPGWILHYLVGMVEHFIH